VTGRDNQIRRKGHLAFMRVLSRFAELGGQPVIRKTIHPKRRKIKRLMEESKRKKIEARLFQLFAQNDHDKNENKLTKKISGGVKVIRRRKGKPDLHIS